MGFHGISKSAVWQARELQTMKILASFQPLPSWAFSTCVQKTDQTDNHERWILSDVILEATNPSACKPTTRDSSC